MRKLLLVAAAAAVVGLSGCTTPFNPATFAAQVQAETQKLCGYVPTAETITNLFATGVPGVQLAETLANAICGAVGPAPKTTALFRAHAAAPPPVLYGVKLKGHYK
jgi:hypothetical protein